MTGAVHEKLTNERVNAMRNIDSKPVVDDALLSIAFPHDDGRRSSNHPKKLNANTTNNRKKNMLNGAFVAKSLSFCGPKMAVIRKASAM